MAEYIARELEPNLLFTSCGIRTLEGYRATDNARIAAAEKGYDISEHRTKVFSPNSLNNFLILCMDVEQKTKIISQTGNLEVFLLTEKGSGSGKDIIDPTKKGLASHRKTIDIIEEEIKLLLKNVRIPI